MTIASVKQSNGLKKCGQNIIITLWHILMAKLSTP